MKGLVGPSPQRSLLCAAVAHASATLVIVNADAPDAGFNDSTPVDPVGGNTGTTLGAQRLIVFQEAARHLGTGPRQRRSPSPCSPTSSRSPATAPGRRWAAPGRPTSSPATIPTLDGGVPPSVFPRQNTWYVSAETQRFAGKQAPLRHRDRPEQLRHPGPLQLDAGRPQRDRLQRVRLVLRARQPAREQARPAHRGAPRVRARAGFHQPHRPQHRRTSQQNEPDIWSYVLYDESTGKHWNELDAAGPQGLGGQRRPRLGRRVGEGSGALAPWPSRHWSG